MTLAVEDCMCPICMCILVEPVTMPCKHTLCYPCFKQNVEESSLACPMCRVRISVWARRSSKNGTLVNKKLWGQIQQLFPDKVEKRQKGLDDSIEEPVFQPMISIAEPGEIRKEYEEQMKRLEAQREEERRKEQEASEALIRKLEEEEERQRQLEVRDRELAKEISQVVNQNASSDDSVLVIEDAIRRQTRSVSTSSSSCSASSSRPPSTINSLFRKMREAEKLRAADEANRKSLSPYPYKCHSPTEKASKQQGVGENGSSPSSSKCGSPTDKSALQHKGRDLFSRTLSSAGLSSRSCTSTSEIGNLGDEDDDENDEDLPSKYVSLGIPSLETAIGNISDRSEMEMFDKDSTERCQSSESMDSISQEISHFRPIRVCPLTPPRKLPSGKVVETPLIRTTPRNLNKTEFGSPVRTLSDLDASSPIMQRRLSELEEERKTNVNKFSKSTSTEVKKDTKKLKSVTVTCDDNLEEKDEHHCNVENTAIASDLDKDNLNENRIPERDGVAVCRERKPSVDKPRLRKLVIPLEPTFDDDDFDIPPLKENNPKSINSETVTISTKQSPVLTKSKSEQDTRVRRKSRKISGKSRMAFGSPQRTITDWIKNSTGCNGQNAFQLEAGCRDDVDGEPVSKMMQSEAVSVPQSTNRPAKKEKKQCKVIKSYPKRERKPYNPDPMWTFVSEVHKGQYIDIDESSKDSSAIRVLEEENDKPIMDQKSHQKKRKPTSFSDAKPNKRRKVTKMCSASSRLKQTATTAGLKSVRHSQAKNSTLNFCSESNLKIVKDAIKRNHHTEEEGEADFRASDIFDREMQELMDRRLAEELSKQYEMEVKTGIRFFKLKGTSEEYNFRRKPKMSS